MAQLPSFQNGVNAFQLMQQKWSGILNPIIANPATNPTILKDIAIVPGLNTINHKLQQPIQGWIVIGIDAPAVLYDQQKLNQTPELTLNLYSSLVCNVTLMVF